MTVWLRDGDDFVDADNPSRRRDECPDCRAPWDPDVDPACPSCGLDRDDLVAAAAFLDREEER